MNSNSTVVTYLNGTATVPQILLAFVLAALVYATFLSAEFLYKSLTAVAKTRTALLPYTYTSDKSQEIRQNPNDPSAIPIVPSDNEHSGIEFSYSCFLNLSDSSFQQDTDGLLHIFHKGYNLPFPLMGPGVFLKGTTNTLRIYMNSTSTWNSYVDIENIPMKKWFHLAIVGRGASVEVYLNGNLSKKLNFEGAIPYQNFGNIFVFSQRKAQMSHSLVPSTDANGIALIGPVSGSMISSLQYFSYALSFTEINALQNVGPSTTIIQGSQDKPPYLADTYWTTQY